MKFILFDIILASWLLILVESFNNYPRPVVIRDELYNQPFIPGFREYSSNDGFYQIIKKYPENYEHTERPDYSKPSGHLEYHKKRTCSGIENAVKESTKFCKRVMKGLKELKEEFHGCDKLETPIGTYCSKDNKCYALSAIYSAPTTPLTFYDVYQKACPCPQKQFSFGDLLAGAAYIEAFLKCFGQTDTSSTNGVVIDVDPTTDECTYITYESAVGSIKGPEPCIPTTTNNFIFACEVPCSSENLPEPQ